MKTHADNLPEPGRLYGLDILRLLCCGAVVGIHVLSTAPALTPLWRSLSFAVPCFVMMSLTLGVPKLMEAKPSARAKKVLIRVLRLGKPYLIWTGVFLLSRTLVGSIRLTPDVLISSLFLGGAAMQLYFVPMLILFTVLAGLLPSNKWVVLAFAGAGVFISLFLQGKPWPSIPFGTAEAAAFPHYIQFELPFLFTGIATGVIWRSFRRHYTRLPLTSKRWLTAIIATISLGALACTASFQGNIGRRLGLWVAATGLLWSALLWPGGCPRPAKRIAEVSFGIFFFHPLLLELLSRLELAMGVDHTSTVITLGRFAVVLLGSIAVALALDGCERTRFLVR